MIRSRRTISVLTSDSLLYRLSVALRYTCGIKEKYFICFCRVDMPGNIRSAKASRMRPMPSSSRATDSDVIFSTCMARACSSLLLCIYPSFMSNTIIQLFNDSLPFTAPFC